MAAGQGFEPRFLGPKPNGLPLADPAIILFDNTPPPLTPRAVEENQLT